LPWPCCLPCCRPECRRPLRTSPPSRRNRPKPCFLQLRTNPPCRRGTSRHRRTPSSLPTSAKPQSLQDIENAFGHLIVDGLDKPPSKPGARSGVPALLVT